METVAIVGVGLIGGSFGLALREGGIRRRDPGRQFGRGAARERWQRGAIDRGAPLAEAARPADLLYLVATDRPDSRYPAPSRSAGAARTRWSPTPAAPSAPSSTRRARSWCSAASFWAAIRMAGKEKRGAAEADADLFRGRTYVLTPASTRGTRNARRARRSSTGWHASARRLVTLGCGRARPPGFVHFAPAATCFHRAGRHDGGEPDRARRSASGRTGLDRHRRAWRSARTSCGATSWRPTATRSSRRSRLISMSWSSCARICGRSGAREEFVRGAEFAGRLRKTF